MANAKNLLNTQTETLGEYLSIDNIYRIPFNQRTYEWGKDQVTRLWDDLVDLSDDNDSVHLLNFFTLYKEDNDELSIYDGQQRTITSLLVVAVLAQRMYQLSPVAGEEIQRKFLTNGSVLDRSIHNKHKLIFDVQADSDVFYELTNLHYHVNQNIKHDHSSANAQALIKNYNLINQLFDEFVESCPDDAGIEVKLRDFYLAMKDHCLLVLLISENDDIAKSMFESLNNTGKEIEKYYVLKNDMVQALGEDRVRDRWHQLDDNLKDQNLDKFLLILAQVIDAKPGNVSSRKVLSSLYDRFDKNDNTKMEQLLDLLVRASSIYQKMLNPTKLTTKDTSQRSAVATFQKYSKYLSNFSVRQHMPILMGMFLDNKSLDEINQVLWAMLVVYVRKLLVKNEKSNVMTKDFISMASELYYDHLSTDQVVARILKYAYPDAEVKAPLSFKQFTNQRVVKTLLTIVYDKSLKNGETQLDVDSVDLEHILPQTPKDDSEWVFAFPDDDERNVFTTRLGNLTLWFSSMNRSIKNAEFDVKKAKYAQSQLPQNQALASYEQWTSDEIKNRTDQLADVVLKTFATDFMQP